MTVLYGIKNCDTVKKARQWLERQGVEYRFHDLRADGLDNATVQHWLTELGPDILVNKRSTTWKQLSEAERTLALSPDAAPLIIDNPTLIKRPLLDTGDKLHCGFKDAMYADIFA